jgi:hypothetical protein
MESRGGTGHMSVAEPRHVAGADSAVENFFTVNAKGEVTAEFEGIIVAKGFSLTENPLSESAPSNSLIWKDATGTGQEFVYGTGNPGKNHTVHMLAQGTEGIARIDALGTDEEAGVRPQVNAAAGGQEKNILKEDILGVATSDYLFTGRKFQQDVELYGAQPEASKALHISLSFKEFLPPGDAFSASVRALEGNNDVRLVRAYWDVAWNPRGKKGNQIQLYTFEGEKTGEKIALALTPESESETPVHPTVLVTTALKERYEKAKKNGSYLTLGYQVKTDAAAVVEPIMFSNYVVLQWELIN